MSGRQERPPLTQILFGTPSRVLACIVIGTILSVTISQVGPYLTNSRKTAASSQAEASKASKFDAHELPTPDAPAASQAEALEFSSPDAEFLAPTVTYDKSVIAVKGKAAGVNTYVVLFKARRLNVGTVVCEGELKQGGLSFGLLSEDGNTWQAQSAAITSPGPFKGRLKIPAPGKYKLVISNALDTVPVAGLDNEFRIDSFRTESCEHSAQDPQSRIAPPGKETPPHAPPQTSVHSGQSTASGGGGKFPTIDSQNYRLKISAENCSYLAENASLKNNVLYVSGLSERPSSYLFTSQPFHSDVGTLILQGTLRKGAFGAGLLTADGSTWVKQCIPFSVSESFTCCIPVEKAGDYRLGLFNHFSAQDKLELDCSLTTVDYSSYNSLMIKEQIKAQLLPPEREFGQSQILALRRYIYGISDGVFQSAGIESLSLTIKLPQQVPVEWLLPWYILNMEYDRAYVKCGDMSTMLFYLYDYFGYPAVRYCYGFKESRTTHVVTLVKYNGNWYLMDPTTNSSYCDQSGQWLPFPKLLDLIDQKKSSEVVIDNYRNALERDIYIPKSLSLLGFNANEAYGTVRFASTIPVKKYPLHYVCRGAVSAENFEQLSNDKIKPFHEPFPFIAGLLPYCLEISSLHPEYVSEIKGLIKEYCKIPPNAPLEFSRPDAEFLASTVTYDKSIITVKGKAAGVNTYVVLFKARSFSEGAVVCEGELKQGGLAFGLLSENGNTWQAQSAAITSPGPFKNCLEIPAPGKYKLVISNALDTVPAAGLDNEFRIDSFRTEPLELSAQSSIAPPGKETPAQETLAPPGQSASAENGKNALTMGLQNTSLDLSVKNCAYLAKNAFIKDGALHARGASDGPSTYIFTSKPLALDAGLLILQGTLRKGLFGAGLLSADGVTWLEQRFPRVTAERFTCFVPVKKAGSYKLCLFNNFSEKSRFDLDCSLVSVDHLAPLKLKAQIQNQLRPQERERGIDQIHALRRYIYGVSDCVFSSGGIESLSVVVNLQQQVPAEWMLSRYLLNMKYDRRFVECGDMAAALCYLYEIFGYPAACYGYGFKDSFTTHVVTLVKFNDSWYLMDPTTNSNYLDKDGHWLPFPKLLDLIDQKKISEVVVDNYRNTVERDIYIPRSMSLQRLDVNKIYGVIRLSSTTPTNNYATHFVCRGVISAENFEALSNERVKPFHAPFPLITGLLPYCLEISANRPEYVSEITNSIRDYRQAPPSLP